jgi:3-oxoacyl-[acyl-carrier-protein] synthase II
LAGSPEKLKRWAEPSYHTVKLLTHRIFARLSFDSHLRDPQRVALIGATAFSSQISRDFLSSTGTADSKFILNQCHNIPLAAAASEFGIRGPSFSVGSACASSGHALLLAAQMIEAGMLDCALVVGHEFPIQPACIGGLEWVNALYRRDEPADRAYESPALASRPFSKDRRGFVLAEGAAALLVSSATYARRHRWPTLAMLRGGYANSDADHLTRIDVDNIAYCMQAALGSARCPVDEVDCINAHATSTPLGDAAELRALHKVFGDRLREIPVVANKSQLGHCLGAASAVALTLSLKGMQEGVVLPTLNHVPDPSLPEAFLPSKALEHPHRLTLLNAFGFGGTNVSLIVELAA